MTVNLPSRLADLRGLLQALDWDRLSLKVQREAAAHLTIVGPVNSGKSTLFNLIKGQKIAAVTAVPGTTRGVIEERMGPFVLVDTPGFGEVGGVDRAEIARQAAQKADAVILLLDAMAGLRQTDLKFVIGYSSVSHMGIVGLGLATMTVDGMNGAVFQMFAHGIMTALFFSSVGYIYDRTHTKAIADLGGLARQMPVASGYFVVAALTGIGVPCLASFWAELMVFIAAFQVYPVYGVVAVSALVVSALFILRVLQHAIFGPANEKFADLPDVSFGLGIPRMILVAAIVIFGLMPFLMYDTIQTSAMFLISGLP